MVQPISHTPDDPISHPDAVIRKKFSTVRRGYDPEEVQRFLRQVAAGLADATTREAEMRTRLGKAVGRAERKERPSDKELTDRLGDEVAQVIQAARDASEERIARAAQEAETTVADAEREANETRRKSQTVLAERTAEAEAAAAEITAEAEANAADIRASAQETLRQSQDQAVANLESARVEGEGLIAQAEAARQQVLHDMDRRRRTMRSQVELLKAGRDRLLQSHEVLRRSLDEIATELQLSVAEAKIKGDNAERRMNELPLSNTDQLETELADAAMIGMVVLPEVERLPELDPDTLAPELRAAVIRSQDGPEAPESAPVGHVSLPVEAAVVAPEKDAPAETDVIDLAEAEAEAASEASPMSVEEEAYASALREEQSDSDAPDVASIEDAEDAEAKTTASVVEVSAMDDVVAAAAADDAAAVDAALEQVTTEAVVEETIVDDAVVEAPAIQDAAIQDAAIEDAAEVVADTPTAEVSVEEPEPVEVARTIEVPAAAAPRGLTLVEPEEAAEPAKTKSAKAKPAKKSSAMDRLFANLRDPEEDAVAEKADAAAQRHPAAGPADDAPTAAAPTGDVADGTEEDSVEGDRSDAALARVRDSGIADLEATIERRAKRVLADEQNAILEWLSSKEFTGSLIDGLPDEAAHVESYLEAVRPQLVASFGAGAAFVGDHNVVSPTEFVDAEEIIADRIVRPIRERFAAAQTDIDADEAVTIVSGFYRGHKTGDFAAHTSWMALRTFSRGTLAALPEGAGIRWAFREGDGGCPDGYDNSFGGTLPAGEAFPSGHTVAPLDARCRCLLVPVEG